MGAGLRRSLDGSARDLDLFQIALGLASPWRVDRSEFDVAGKRLDLYMDFHPGGTFACPECGGQGCECCGVRIRITYANRSTQTWPDRAGPDRRPGCDSLPCLHVTTGWYIA
jgi:hypothetical protein